MPSKTFENLSEEKKNRIIEASVKEFSMVPFEKTSINKIIKDAGISRGSFYMYFKDKYDLTAYLFKVSKDFLMDEIKEIGLSVSGKLDAFVLELHSFLYDYYIKEEYRTFFINVITHFQGNKESGVDYFKGNIPEFNEFENMYAFIDKEQFGNKDKKIIIQTIDIALNMLRNVMFKAFMMDLDKEASRELLSCQLNILKQGYGRNE